MLIKSDHTYLNLIFCGPEWINKKMALAGELWLHATTHIHAEFVVHMDQCQRVVVVHGSGRILNSIWEEIMEDSQRLLDALGNQGWNTRAIKDVVDQMSDMVEEYHESFKGIWFSGFVQVGQEGPLEMITTCAVRAVNYGAGRD
jgi:hypothetical protein